MMSIFGTACLTELGAKTGYMYHALTNLQMSSDLLINQPCALHSDHYVSIMRTCPCNVDP